MKEFHHFGKISLYNRELFSWYFPSDIARPLSSCYPWDFETIREANASSLHFSSSCFDVIYIYIAERTGCVCLSAWTSSPAYEEKRQLDWESRICTFNSFWAASQQSFILKWQGVSCDCVCRLRSEILCFRWTCDFILKDSIIIIFRL